MEDCSEAMHSLRGAFSETVYIYGTALCEAARRGAPEPVLSMGLGLGYVELLASGVALATGRALQGESFEIVPELRDYFKAWLSGGECPQDFVNAYDSIAQRTAEEVSKGLPGLAATDVTPTAVKHHLATAVANGAWKLREALEPATSFSAPFGCICFDAFSSKTTPDLWSEDFLISFLKKAAAPQAVLSTYACTGALKRALRAEGFTITIREGFSSKRDSTFATR